MRNTLEPEADPALLEAIAAETVTMSSSVAWATIGVRLATAGIRHMSDARQKTWDLRRGLLLKPSD